MAIRRAEGSRIGRRVFMDRCTRTMDGEMVTIGDDAVVAFGGELIGHDMAACNIMVRQPTVVAAGVRIGECARIGAGAEVRRDVPPTSSTFTGERLL